MHADSTSCSKQLGNVRNILQSLGPSTFLPWGLEKGGDGGVHLDTPWLGSNYCCSVQDVNILAVQASR